MLVAITPRRLARGQIADGLIAAHRHLAIEQRHVDVLARAVERPVIDRGENRHRRVHAGEYIGHGDAHFLRTAAGQVIALAGDAHQPAQPLEHEVVAGLGA